MNKSQMVSIVKEILSLLGIRFHQIRATKESEKQPPVVYKWFVIFDVKGESQIGESLVYKETPAKEDLALDLRRSVAFTVLSYVRPEARYIRHAINIFQPIMTLLEAVIFHQVYSHTQPDIGLPVEYQIDNAMSILAVFLGDTMLKTRQCLGYALEEHIQQQLLDACKANGSTSKHDAFRDSRVYLSPILPEAENGS